MASLDASIARQNREQEAKIRAPDKVVTEGVESMIPYKGSVKEILQQFLGGLKSGMSYCGAKTIAELQKNAEFVKITSAGLKESNAHDVDVIDK